MAAMVKAILGQTTTGMEIHMKLKSLLLGSAAALVAFSGARAADAVIAEPEPVEYVRVCDAFGAGYFYLPGTETCLKIGGFVRYDIDVDSEGESFGKNTVASLQFSAKSDTELGTLEGFIDFRTGKKNSIRFDGPPVVAAAATTSVGLESAYISLGGLKMGYFANAFDGGLVGEYDSLGGSTGNTISYTFASDGFDATIGLDEDVAETNYVPNISANAGFTAGAFAVRAFVSYDEELGNTAVKLRVGADVTEGGRLEAALIYSSDPTYSWSASEWSIAAGYKQKVSDQVSITVNGQYWANTNGEVKINGNDVVAGGVKGVYASGDAFLIGANVDWTPVKNFLVRGQVAYYKFDGATAANPDTDGIIGKVRFQRSF
jgi:Porin subfamily